MFAKKGSININKTYYVEINFDYDRLKFDNFLEEMIFPSSF